MYEHLHEFDLSLIYNEGILLKGFPYPLLISKHAEQRIKERGNVPIGYIINEFKHHRYTIAMNDVPHNNGMRYSHVIIEYCSNYYFLIIHNQHTNKNVSNNNVPVKGIVTTFCDYNAYNNNGSWRIDPNYAINLYTKQMLNKFRRLLNETN